MSERFRLRTATEDDADSLGAVHVQAWREAYADMLPHEILAGLDPVQRTGMWRDGLARGAVVRLAEQDGAIVGFSSGGRQLDPSLPYSAEIHAIYVLRRAQRLGIGRSLMAATAGDLLARGHACAMLWVLEANTPARRFYAVLGGREIARREQQRDGFSAVGIAYGWDDLKRLT
jgi:ribosomal protein S18 acetylase RimI-like enzyme